MPYVDGDIIPTNPVKEDGFAESGKGIPLLIGSNLNEWNFTMNGGSKDETTVLNDLNNTYSGNGQAVLDAFKNAYPGVDVTNVELFDTMLRTPLLKITAHKVDQNGAPVYSYIMTYGAPQAVHGGEIPLIFDNTAAENESMAEIMRGVWAQFARTGNPTIEGLPEWEPYTREGGAAMILDLESHIGYHHDEELLNLTKPGYEY